MSIRWNNGKATRNSIRWNSGKATTKYAIWRALIAIGTLASIAVAAGAQNRW